MNIDAKIFNGIPTNTTIAHKKVCIPFLSIQGYKYSST